MEITPITTTGTVNIGDTVRMDAGPHRIRPGKVAQILRNGRTLIIESENGFGVVSAHEYTYRAKWGFFARKGERHGELYIAN